MTDTGYTTTLRLAQQDAPQLTIRADDPEELVSLLDAVPDLAGAILKAYESYRSIVLVGDALGGTVVKVEDTRPTGGTATSQAGQSASQGSANQGQAAAANLLLNGEHTIAVDNKFGTKVGEYNRPDAPSTVRGPKVLLTQKSQAGNWYTQWVDPADSPAWFPRPKVDLQERKNAREFPDNDTQFDHTAYLPN